MHTDSSSKGVSFLLAKLVPWNENAVIVDDLGRLLIVKGLFFSHKFTLVSMHLPNKGHSAALEHCLEQVNLHREGTLVDGRNCNTVSRSPTGCILWILEFVLLKDQAILSTLKFTPGKEESRFLRLLHCGLDRLQHFIKSEDPLSYDRLQAPWEADLDPGDVGNYLLLANTHT